MLLILADRYHENQQFDRQRAILERCLRAVPGISDVGLRSRAACAEASSLAEKGDHDRAAALLADALSGLSALPDGAWDEVPCRVTESFAAKLRGDSAQAISSAERAVALEDGRGGPTEGKLDALSALAGAYSLAGRFGSADATARRLAEAIEAQGRGNTRYAAIALSNWSAMLQNAGQHQAALPLSERAIAIARAQDTENGASLSELATYGSALCVVGRAMEAVPVLDEAVAKARRAGSPRRLVLTLAQASIAYREAGDLDRAEQVLGEADAILKSDATTPPHAFSVLDRNRSRAALARGDSAGAVQLAARALAVIDAAKRPANETMPALLALAEAQNTGGAYGPARATAERAVRTATERLGEMKHSYNAGQAHLELGVALAGQGDIAGGRVELQRALEHLQPSVGPDAPSTRRALGQLDASRDRARH